MNGFKRILALLVTLALVSGFSAVYASDITTGEKVMNITDNFTVVGEESVTGNTEQAPVESKSEALEKLNAFGVVIGDLGTDAGVTRAELISVIMRSIGITDGKSDKQYFYDVPADNSYAIYINSAFEMGIVSGSDGFFHPDNLITYNEAVSMLVKVMGLHTEADYVGGYPMGYLRVANDADILDYVEISDYNIAANPDDICVMLVNALTSDSYMKLAGVGADGAITTNKTGITMLEKYFGILAGEGIVNAVGISNTLAKTTVGTDKVMIGDYLYGGSYDEYIDLLGYDVDFYYTKEEGELVYACKRASANKTLVLYDGVIGTYANNQYSYIPDGKDKYAYANVGTDASFMFNGTIASSSIENLYVPKNGTVTLISNDHDSEYDVVIIDSYIDIVVGAVDLTKATVYDRFDNTKNACFEEKDGKIVKLLNGEGKETFVSFLKEYDIISVKKSVNNECVYGVVSPLTASGMIEKVGTDGDATVVTVKGIEYKVTETCKSLCDKNIAAGKTVTLYLNIMGKVAYIKTGTSNNMQYGYVIKYTSSGGVLDDSIAIRILSQDGTINGYNVKQSCKIDGDNKKTFNDQMAALDTGLASHKLVKFEKDANGEISVIDTAYVNPDCENEENSLTYFEDGSDFTTDMHYKTSGNVGDKYFWNTATIFFAYMPGASEEKEMYKVLPKGAIANDTKYKVAGYKDEKSFVADAMLFKLDSVSGSVSSEKWAVVTKVYETLTEDGYDAVMLETASGANVENVVIEKSEYDSEGYDFSEGDVVRYDMIDGKLMDKAIKKVYDFDDKKITDTRNDGTEYGNDNGTNDVYSLRHGYVYDKIGDYFMLAPVTKTELAVFNRKNGLIIEGGASGMDITLVEKTRNGITVTAGSAKDLRSYLGSAGSCSNVLVRYMYMMHRQMIIFNDTEEA